jgi:TonB-linked SusC/RagA family outer membrane protein
MRVIYLILSFWLITFQLGFSQNRTITGKVTNAEDGTPLPGASVVLKGTTNGTITSTDGTYTLSVPNDAQTLQFLYIGMVTQEIPIAGLSTINAALYQSIVGIDEVVVVAYGTTKKTSFTGSVDVLKSDKIEKRTVSSVTKAIEGTVAGVQTTSGGGQPGDGVAIRIRGFGSINASSAPLYVVDGVAYDGNINAINPNDIESVSVLKDASASSLYGARAANGVIIISTKKGTKGETKVSLKANYGISSRAYPRYETLNASEYMEIAYEAYKNQLIYADGEAPASAASNALSGYMAQYGGEIYNPFNMASDELIDISTGKINKNAGLKYSEDWLDEATRDNPTRQEYQIAITSGSDKSSYLISLGYLDEKGLVSNSMFKRYNGRLNVDSKIKEWIKGGMSAAFSSTKQNYLTNAGTSYNNIWYSAQTIAPIYPVYMHDEDGALILKNGQKQFDYGETRPYASNFNSIATLYDDKRSLDFDNLSGRTFLKLDTDNDNLGFIKDLSLTLNFGFDYNHGERLIYNNPFHGDGASVNGRISKYSYRTFSYTFNQLLNYTKQIDKHNFDLLFGHEYYEYNSNSLAAYKQGFAFGQLYELTAASVPTGADSQTDKYTVEGYFSRLNYNFSDKYYISGSYRKDGSARFYSDSRWGDFWSVGASWRMSSEDFLKQYTWLNNLSLKGSYGYQGNDMLLDGDGNDNYYAWQSFYSLAYPNNSMGGVWISSLENKEVRWEKNHNLNFGIESKFLDRIILSVEWFKKTTSDLLLYKPKAVSTGFNGYWDNVGAMENKGWDVSLSLLAISKKNIQWNFSTIWNYIRNEVTELSTEGQEIISGSRIIKVGEPINSFYLPKSAGVDPLDGSQLYWIKTTNAQGEEVEEISNSYAQAASNKYILGSRIPDFYGSFTNDFKIFNFDLSVLCTYSVGGKVLDGVYSTLMSTRDAGGSLHKNILRRWQKPGDITDVPRIELGATNQVTDFYLIDASYFAIKNISLGYNVPKKILTKAKIDNIRLSLTLDNFWLFSKLKGSDPQYNFTGGQDYAYAPIRTFSFGIDVKF